MEFAINNLPRIRPAALAFALAFAALGVVALESTFRLKGFQPSLSDSDSLWAVSRTLAKSDDAGIILVGSSRFHLGIHPTQLARETNTSVINLAISGTSSFPIFHDLVESDVKPDFLLIEYIPARWVNELPVNLEKAKAPLGYFHTQPYTSKYEVFLRTQLGERWVVLNPILNLRSIPTRLSPGNNTDQSRYKIHPDRFMETLYKDIKNTNKTRPTDLPIKENHTDPEFWINNAHQQITDFESAVTRIQKSGTKVIVFSIPVCESQLILDRETYGEPALFNELKSRSQATWLAPHELDLPDIECTDGSHLTPESASTVTKALAKWLNARPTPPTQAP